MLIPRAFLPVVSILALATAAHAEVRGGYIQSTIRAVDPGKRTVLLADGSRVTLGQAVDPAPLAPGQKVRIFAETDEDGLRPATGVIRLD